MNDDKLKILIKYHDQDIHKIEKIAIGNWIDLRAAETVHMNKFDFQIISLGISMKLPQGYEAHIAPRSSTYKNYHVLQTNGVGVIDEAYCGDDDIWGFPALAMKDTTINKGDRICQFRIVKEMEPVEFVEVEHLEDESRGGWGSTGVA